MSPAAKLQHDVIHKIGSSIVSGRLAPYDVVTEKDLVAEHHVSRIVVREAVKSLSALGLVATRPRVGVIIQPNSKWNITDARVLSWLGSVDKDLFLQIYETRIVFCPGLVMLAALKATDEDIVILTQAYGELEKAIGDEQAYFKAEINFYDKLIEASHNSLLQYLQRTVIAALINEISGNEYSFSPNGKRQLFRASSHELLQNRREMLVAIREHNVERAVGAEVAMLRRSEEFLMPCMPSKVNTVG